MTPTLTALTGMLRRRRALDVIPELCGIADALARQGPNRPRVRLVATLITTIVLLGLVPVVLLVWTAASQSALALGLFLASVCVVAVVDLSKAGTDMYVRLGLLAMGGLRQLPAPLVLSPPALSQAVRSYARRRLTGPEREVFAGLAADWEGTFGELLQASRTLG
jgi:hypothetical protein